MCARTQSTCFRAHAYDSCRSPERTAVYLDVCADAVDLLPRIIQHTSVYYM